MVSSSVGRHITPLPGGVVLVQACPMCPSKPFAILIRTARECSMSVASEQERVAQTVHHAPV